MTIREEKEIKATTPQISSYSTEGHTKTTPGYVYLTNNSLTALDFASRCFTEDECSANLRMLVVFEIMLDPGDVQDDEDEKIWQSTTESNAKSFRFWGNIDFSDKKINNIGFFNFNSTESCYKYIDNSDISGIRWTSFEDAGNPGKHKIMETFNSVSD